MTRKSAAQVHVEALIEALKRARVNHVSYKGPDGAVVVNLHGKGKSHVLNVIPGKGFNQDA